MAKAPTSNSADEPDTSPDTSMDDILASIRRILDEDPSSHGPPAEDVLVLDSSMLVDEAAPAASEPPHPLATAATERETPPSLAADDEFVHTTPVIETQLPPPLPTVAREAPSLVAPEAAAAAQNSVGALMRTLAAERSAVVSRSGVTIEDLVREEIKPLLKQWLDTHLPTLVERLVRAEIERVVGREAG